MPMRYSNTERATKTFPCGIVFDIKRFGIHDGPGIRTTVFFKGCPLSCFWCHNPESQSRNPELLVDQDRCNKCGVCVDTCPAGAIRSTGGSVTTDREVCIGCGTCVGACPTGTRAIAGEEWSVERLLAIVEADTVFYDESAGGVTLSGGEPLQQPDVALALLHACNDKRIHTAVDTCGCVDERVLRSASEVADLFLYDIKVIDDVRHRAATGVSNATILENVRLLDSLGSRIWIRIPFIPGFNDDEANLIDTGRFIASLPHVEAAQLLPYHRGGERKRQELGRGAGVDVEPPTQSAVDEAIEILKSFGEIPIRIGG